MDRSTLQTRTRLAQAGAAIGAGVTVLIALFGLPSLGGGDDEPGGSTGAAAPVANQPAPSDAVELPEVDIELIASALASVGNAPTPPEPVVEDNEPSPADDPIARNDEGGDQPASARDVRYLGAMIGSSRRVAVLVIDGMQRLVAEGGERDGVAVTELSTDAAQVEIDGVPMRLTVAPRKGPRVTYVDPGAVAGAAITQEARENVRRGARGANRAGMRE